MTPCKGDPENRKLKRSWTLYILDCQFHKMAYQLKKNIWEILLWSTGVFWKFSKPCLLKNLCPSVYLTYKWFKIPDTVLFTGLWDYPYLSIVQTLACNLQKSFQTSVRVKQKLFSSRQWLRIIVAYLLLVIVKWKDTMRVHNKNKFNKEICICCICDKQSTLQAYFGDIAIWFQNTSIKWVR